LSRAGAPGSFCNGVIEFRAIVKNSIESEKRDKNDPDALASLVLDFDCDGRLFGIEIVGRADKTLRSELLARAKRI
jgi:hypothetical protein